MKKPILWFALLIVAVLAVYVSTRAQTQKQFGIADRLRILKVSEGGIRLPDSFQAKPDVLGFPARRWWMAQNRRATFFCVTGCSELLGFNDRIRFMRELVVIYIKDFVSKGEVIKLRKLYADLYSKFPEACQRLGFTASNPIEEKWKNEIRYGLWAARKQGMIKHVGTQKSGEWQRI